MSGSPGLRVFGFPLQVRPGFALLLLLVVVVNPGPLGVWLAVGITGFTLLHELGHAAAARATGARAEISLDFLAGYASFQPTRTLKPWERAAISLAGPAIQIVAGVSVLAAIGVNPLDRDDVTSSDAALALWWAGPIIGLFNLIPIVPLDGGGIVGAAVEKVAPRHAQTLMLYGSIVVTVAGGIALYTIDEARPLATFLVFPLLIQLQMLAATRPGGMRAEHQHVDPTRAAAAETAAWAGARTLPPPGVQLSPWVRAHHALMDGDRDKARHVLADSFAVRQMPVWATPEAASTSSLEALVDLLPEPLPTGDPYAELVLAGVLTRLGRFEQAARYAAAAHARHPSAGASLIVARCAAALGDGSLAVRWLEVAAATSTQPAWLAHAIDHAAEFATIRHSAEMRELRDALAST